MNGAEGQEQEGPPKRKKEGREKLGYIGKEI